MLTNQNINQQPLRISLYEYLAYNVPADAYALIQEYGTYPRPTDPEELVEQLKHFVRKNGQEGIKLLGEIHPDKDLFSNSKECKECKVKEIENNVLKDNLKELQTEKKIQEIAYRNLSGNYNVSTGTTNVNSQSVNSNMIIMSAFILLGVAYLLKK